MLVHACGVLDHKNRSSCQGCKLLLVSFSDPLSPTLPPSQSLSMLVYACGVLEYKNRLLMAAAADAAVQMMPQLAPQVRVCICACIHVWTCLCVCACPQGPQGVHYRP